MKFKFLLIGLLVIFSSVGSYAEDYLRFNLKSIELLENTWGRGNAKLKLFILVDNLDEGQSQLDISHKEFLPLGVNEELALSGKAGISRLTSSFDKYDTVWSLDFFSGAVGMEKRCKSNIDYLCKNHVRCIRDGQ